MTWDGALRKARENPTRQSCLFTYLSEDFFGNRKCDACMYGTTHKPIAAQCNIVCSAMRICMQYIACTLCLRRRPTVPIYACGSFLDLCWMGLSSQSHSLPCLPQQTLTITKTRDANYKNNSNREKEAWSAELAHTYNHSKHKHKHSWMMHNCTALRNNDRRAHTFTGRNFPHAPKLMTAEPENYFIFWSSAKRKATSAPVRTFGTKLVPAWRSISITHR